MADLAQGIPAIMFCILFGLCILPVLAGIFYDYMSRISDDYISRPVFKIFNAPRPKPEGPKFRSIWLWPLVFALYRCVTMAYLAFEAFQVEQSPSAQKPAWVGLLVFAFYAKIFLFGPLFLVDHVFAPSGTDNPDFSFDPSLWLDLARTRARADHYEGEFERLQAVWKYLFPVALYALGLAVVSFGVVDAVLRGLHISRASGESFIDTSFVRALGIATPILQSVFPIWLVKHAYYNRHCRLSLGMWTPMRFIYLLLVFMLIANAYQLVLRSVRVELSLWYFWALQVSMEFAMTLTVVLAMICAIRNYQPGFDDHHWVVLLYPLWSSRPHPRPSGPTRIEDLLPRRAIDEQLGRYARDIFRWESRWDWFKRWPETVSPCDPSWWGGRDTLGRIAALATDDGMSRRTKMLYFSRYVVTAYPARVNGIVQGVPAAYFDLVEIKPNDTRPYILSTSSMLQTVPSQASHPYLSSTERPADPDDDKAMELQPLLRSEGPLSSDLDPVIPTPTSPHAGPSTPAQAQSAVHLASPPSSSSHVTLAPTLLPPVSATLPPTSHPHSPTTTPTNADSAPAGRGSSESSRNPDLWESEGGRRCMA